MPSCLPAGQKWKAILFVTCAQMLCGVAKDLTKLGGKTVTKLVTPDEKHTRLFKLVSLITGWKNSLKGGGASLVLVRWFGWLPVGWLGGLCWLGGLGDWVVGWLGG